MAGTRECNSAVTAGRLSKAVEFYDAAEHLEDNMPNAAGDLFVDAGIAASTSSVASGSACIRQAGPTAKPSLC